MKNRILIIIIIQLILFGALCSHPGTTRAIGLVASQDRTIIQGEPEVNWVQRFPENFPGPRRYHAIAYDSARGMTVLFGGSDDKSVLVDTWEWDGMSWTQIFPYNRPSRRSNHAMAYDSVREVTVLFGGYGDGQNHNDTWEWNGTDWIKRSSANSPPARSRHAMAYDRERGVTVMFGGYITSGANIIPLDDTWEWNGSDWKQCSPENIPNKRYLHALAYDSARQVTILFGGKGSSSSLNDTWEWDGTDWSQRFPVTFPTAQSGHAMTYDAGRQVTVLFGLFSQTWEWDGMDWIRREPPSRPSMRSDHALAYDEDRAVTILFGGYYSYLSGGKIYKTWFGETWEYIVLSQLVQADFSAQPTSGPAPLQVNFTNQSTGGYETCEWDFGDGGTSDECDDPTHTYSMPGVYTVSLTVSGSSGEDTLVKAGYIHVEGEINYKNFLPLITH